AGAAVNFVTPGVVGGTIAGGGASSFFGTASSNRVSGNFATVGGGSDNSSAGQHATVGGGFGNTSASGDSTVGGGNSNTSSGGTATVGGGFNNTSSGLAATVAGGTGNMASGRNATVVGGEANNVAGDYAIVGGGRQNNASGHSAVVTGGDSNLATNIYATIPGGGANVAGGAYSFAAGQQAKALHRGSFVWADPQSTDFASTTTNQFLIRASGGVGIAGNTPVELGFGIAGKEINAGKIAYGLFTANALDIVGGGTTPASRSIKFWCEGGATFTGAINAPSDRSVKRDFQAVNTRDVLDKVAALPIQSWAYTYDQTRRHIGPVAQDFYSAFGLNGDDDKHIATVDADGVALAAIQGLNQKLENRLLEQAAQIESLKVKAGRVEELEKRLAYLERRFAATSVTYADPLKKNIE
ncbi:MAG TPA: tail fiber domain-containing protein, partial [Candidatus Binatia bacterium]|nr:tail fiber domain-containing protein [Candidatus Binatia bacterium]